MFALAAGALVSIFARRRSRSQFVSFRLTQTLHKKPINRVQKRVQNNPATRDDSHNTRKSQSQNMFPPQRSTSPRLSRLGKICKPNNSPQTARITVSRSAPISSPHACYRTGTYKPSTCTTVAVTLTRDGRGLEWMLLLLLGQVPTSLPPPCDKCIC